MIFLIVPGDAKDLAVGVKNMLEIEFGDYAEAYIFPEEKIDMIRKRQPDFVIILSRFLRIECAELIGEIRHISPNTAIIASSADKVHEQESLAAGADAFILKPFYADELLSCVYSFIENASV